MGRRNGWGPLRATNGLTTALPTVDCNGMAEAAPMQDGRRLTAGFIVEAATGTPGR